MLAKIFKPALFTLVFLNLFFFSAVAAYRLTLKGERVTLPNLIGMTFEEAKTALNGKKLGIMQIGVQLHDRYERGKIIFQDPAPDSKIRLYTAVKVILSAGKEKVVVPQLIGKHVEFINKLLGEAGLNKGKISHVHTPKYAAGKIIAQHPLAFEEAAKNSRVSLLISQGEEEKKYLLPDLIGKRAAAVIAKLREMEFRIGDIRYVYYPGLESGIIIKQFPPQGFRIQKRNLITLEVSK